jgi:hypothetical protein
MEYGVKTKLETLPHQLSRWVEGPKGANRPAPLALRHDAHRGFRRPSRRPLLLPPRAELLQREVPGHQISRDSVGQ